MSRLVVAAGLLAGLTTPAPVEANFLVSSEGSHQVLQYSDTGVFLGVFASGGGLNRPGGLAFGPGGDLYVSETTAAQVLRYDGTTGAFEGVFASGGGLDAPLGLVFGPNGDLIVAGADNFFLTRYDGTTGAYLGRFGDGLPRDVAVGRDGNLYVTNRFGTNTPVAVYNGTTLAPVGAVGTGSGIAAPVGLAFGTDGDLFVADNFSDSIYRFDGSTGAFESIFVTAGSGGLLGPYGLTFGPDGDLFVASRSTNQILRYDGTTGAFEGVFASGGGLETPSFLLHVPAAVPEPSTLVSLVLGGLSALGCAWRRGRSGQRRLGRAAP